MRVSGEIVHAASKRCRTVVYGLEVSIRITSRHLSGPKPSHVNERDEIYSS